MLLKKILLRNSKHKNFICIFSISEALSDFWENYGVCKTKLLAWHDGFENDMFFTDIDKDTARSKLGLPENKKIVCYSGSLYDARGIGEMIVKLARQYPEAHFVVVGGPESGKKKLEEMSVEYSVKNIQFIGAVERSAVPDYLFAADILLALFTSKIPTINVCSPLKVFEYMASGRIILVPAFPTIVEVLSDKEAVLCEPDSYDDLRNKLGTVLNNFDEYLPRGRSARVKAFELYTWEHRAKVLLDFVETRLSDSVEISDTL